MVDAHGVLELQTIPGQWLQQTAAAALVPAGHKKIVNWSPLAFDLMHGALRIQNCNIEQIDNKNNMFRV